MCGQCIQQNITYVNGYGVRYIECSALTGRPDDKILILLHGIGASAERWLNILPNLCEHFRVVVPDIVGFGYSDKPTVEYTMDFFIKFLNDFLEQLQIKKTSIIGSSFGGHLATEFAIRSSAQVDKLVLAAPAGAMRSSTPVLDQYILAALYPTTENALRAFSNMAYDPIIVTDHTILDFVNRMRLPNAKYAFMSTLLGMKESPRLPGRLSKIESPTLLIWGDNDRMIPLQYSREYEEIPQSTIKIVNDCGHTPYVEKPIIFTKVISDFLL